MEKVTITIPSETLKKLDRFIQPYKRSQAVNYAILAMMAADKREQDAYRVAFGALVRGK